MWGRRLSNHLISLAAGHYWQVIIVFLLCLWKSNLYYSINFMPFHLPYHFSNTLAIQMADYIIVGCCDSVRHHLMCTSALLAWNLSPVLSTKNIVCTWGKMSSAVSLCRSRQKLLVCMLWMKYWEMTTQEGKGKIFLLKVVIIYCRSLIIYFRNHKRLLVVQEPTWLGCSACTKITNNFWDVTQYQTSKAPGHQVPCIVRCTCMYVAKPQGPVTNRWYCYGNMSQKACWSHHGAKNRRRYHHN